MDSIAIIGAGGFVGTRLVESCILSNVKNIFPIVRSYHNLARLSRFGLMENIRIADAENEENLIKALQDCPIVVNLISDEPAGIINSTKVIYKSCQEVGVKRLIHLSSAVVFGQVNSPEIDDDSPILKNHWMPYAKAKIKAELYLKDMINLNSVEITVLRPAIVWGPRSIWTLNAAFDMMNNCIYLVGNGSGVCNTIYIDNLISSILCSCNYESNATGFFNISDDEYITWRDFYGSLAKYLKYDMSKIPSIPDDRFRPSFNTRLQDLLSLPIYFKLRKYIRPEIRASIKQAIMKIARKDNTKSNLGSKFIDIDVTREMWHLQKTNNKIPNSKFSRQFKYLNPFSFKEATEKTINWLKYLGI